MDYFTFLTEDFQKLVKNACRSCIATYEAFDMIYLLRSAAFWVSALEALPLPFTTSQIENMKQNFMYKQTGKLERWSARCDGHCPSSSRSRRQADRGLKFSTKVIHLCKTIHTRRYKGVFETRFEQNLSVHLDGAFFCWVCNHVSRLGGQHVCCIWPYFDKPQTNAKTSHWAAE